MSKLNKKRNFADDIIITDDTYAGQLALPYVTAAVKSPDTIAKGYCRQIDGLNKATFDFSCLIGRATTATINT